MSRSAEPPNVLLELASRLVEGTRVGKAQLGESVAIDVDEYLDPRIAEAERITLFGRYPQAVLHASALPRGHVRALDVSGQPVLLTRQDDGEVHGMLNVCRHRGMQLRQPGEAVPGSTISCPYHGWTYALDGRLKGVPMADCFANLDRDRRSLVRLPVTEAHGFIWLVPQPGQATNLSEFLAGIGAELDYFGASRSMVYREQTALRNCNWKLIVDAFLEAYHVRVLHRSSIERFFVNTTAVSDRVGLHFRSAVARSRIGEAHVLPPEQWDLREHMSFTYYLFPNSVFVVHPDYLSHMLLTPVGPDQTIWRHTMLIPDSASGQDMQDHWERSYELIGRGVFESEDLFAAEGIHAGLRSGANEQFETGEQEYLLGEFHRLVADAAGWSEQK